MLSAEQNGSQSEDIKVIDESQAENRPVPVQEAEIRWKKVSVMFVLLSGRSRDNSRRPLTVPVKVALHVTSGYVSNLLVGTLLPYKQALKNRSISISSPIKFYNTVSRSGVRFCGSFDV